MNTAMFLQTMLEVLKYDSKFKDKKSALLPILRRAKINNLPQWEFVRGGRSGQRYENVELRVPVPLLDEANAAFNDLYELIEYVYEESDDYGLGGVPIRPQILSPEQVEYKEHGVVFTEIQETIIQGIRDAKYTIWAAVAWLSNQAIIDELIDVCVKNMVNENFTEEQARTYLKEMLPKLDYWKRYDELSDNGQFEEFKKQLINEINDLHIDGLPRVDKLNALVGKYVNLKYTLPNGQKVKFLDDQKTYLRNQLESEFGGNRCFGILAGMDFILVCTYEKAGENPELLIYKKR